ncbi:MAG: N-acetylneuraminate synthase family protein [Spirochaetaceae bacterium]
MSTAGQGGHEHAGGPPRVIAEIGTSHGGDLTKARELIRAAVEAGAQVAKFQAVIAEEIVHPEAGRIDLPGGAVSIYDRFRALEQPPEFYAALQEECISAGIAFLCTPFGLGSASMLSKLQIREWKIASPELNHLPLLHYVGETGLPLLLSSGVSTLADIELAVATLRSRGPREITVLHCVTSYPAPAEEYNLRLLPHLSALFGVEVGVSDHSEDPELIPGLAVLMGAQVVEKHITLSRAGGGLDDPIALEPEEFRRTVGVAQRVWQLLRAGSARDTVLREFRDSYGERRVESVLGSGRKELAPSEAGNYGTTNRSILLREDSAAGTAITRDRLAVLRSEHNLSPGLHPRFLESVVGAILQVDLPAGTGLTWEHLLRKAPE